jgi:hypothetical protein
LTDVVQIVSIVVSGGLLAAVIELVRRGRLSEEYSFIWIVSAAALLVLSLWRNLLDVAAAALGVHYPPAVLLLVLTFFVVIVSLYFSVVVSRHRKDIEKLVEDIALLEADIRTVRESSGTVSAVGVVPHPADERTESTSERRLGRYQDVGGIESCDQTETQKTAGAMPHSGSQAKVVAGPEVYPPG